MNIDDHFKNQHAAKAESVSPAPQRYKLELLKLGGCDMRHSDDGQYVLHSEYVSLREELAEKEADNKRLMLAKNAAETELAEARADISSLTGYKFAVAEAHKKLDTAGIPPAVGVACDDPTCNSHIAHRVHTVLSQLADMRKALKTYAWHSDECEYDDPEGGGLRWQDGDEAACTCGLAKALEVKP